MDASFILIIAGAIASQGVSLAKADIPQSLAKLVSSLTRSSNTELTIISDFSTPDQKDFAANLGAVDIPLTIFEIDAISQLVQKEEFANEPCPLVGPTNASRARHSYRLPKGHIITRWASKMCYSYLMERGLITMYKKYQSSELTKDYIEFLYLLQKAVGASAKVPQVHPCVDRRLGNS